MQKAIKSLGQNFIQNKQVVNTMVDLLNIKPNFNIVEIGPGPGVFTKQISLKINETNNFYAIELDKRFVNQLNDKYKNIKNIYIIEDNFLDWARNVVLSGDTLMLGAIPYYITSPIIHNIVKMVNKPKVVVLMIQKEVAEKICEKGVKSNYFSTFVKTFYDVSYIDTVSKNDFIPVPKVDSAIIKLTLKDDFYGIIDIAKYQKFLHKGFKNQKKMLNKVFDDQILGKVGFLGTQRPHELSVSTWVKLYNLQKDS